jgi:HEAT repeat protein
MKTYDHILTGHPELQRKSILALGEARCTEAIPFLKELLVSQTGRIRDAAAISLSEMEAQEAVPLIMELILHPDNETTRGSLIFSLWNLDCEQYFLDFVDIVCYANYESRHNALELLQKYKYVIGTEARKEALDMLRAKRIVAGLQEGAEKEIAFIEYVEGLLSAQ